MAVLQSVVQAKADAWTMVFSRLADLEGPAYEVCGFESAKQPLEIG